MNKQAICPECNKPCGPHRPGAKVYHWSCLMVKFKPLREKWKKDADEKRRQLRQAYQRNASGN